MTAPEAAGRLACRRAAGLRAAHPRRDLPGRDHKSRRRASRDRAVALRRPARRCCARSTFATSKRACPASWGSGPRPGTGCSAPPRPAELHPFREIRAGARHAVSTPGDLLFHIRAKRMDLCFELATQIMARHRRARSRRSTRCTAFATSTTATSWASSTARRIRAGEAAIDAALIGDEDPAFAGGSYVIVQKYLHDLDGMERAADRGAGAHHRPHQALRHRAGRRRQADLGAQRAHRRSRRTARRSRSCATTCRSASVGEGEFGTYFIGYSRSPRTIEQMLENMFVGRPPGNYDRLLDFSRAVTGSLFFVPSATFLEAVHRTTSRRSTAPSAPSAGGRTVTIRPRRCAMVRSASAPSKETSGMNNLHRELAPISDAAWAQIEEEASRTLKRYLAGRRVVDVHGPGGTALVGRRHRPPAARSRRPATASSRGSARSRRWSSCAFRSSSIARRSTTSSAAPTIPTGSRRRTPRDRSPSPRTARSSTAMPPPASRASARAPAIRS